MDDARRWADKYRNRISILRIALEEGVDPGTVSAWLRKVGVEVRPGQHFVKQPPLKYPEGAIDLVLRGTKEVVMCIREKVWGVQVTGKGLAPVEKFCRFLSMHKQGLGVKEIAKTLQVHRSTIAEWREGTDQPYLIKIAIAAIEHQCEPGWKILPLRLSSGAGEQFDWIRVPVEIISYGGVAQVISQLQSLKTASVAAAGFGITDIQLVNMREELFAYVIAMMVGDSANLGVSRSDSPPWVLISS